MYSAYKLKKHGDNKAALFYAKMGSIKDKNGMDLREAENIKKIFCFLQKENTKKIFMTQITMAVWSLTYSQTSWNAKSSEP